MSNFDWSRDPGDYEEFGQRVWFELYTMCGSANWVDAQGGGQVEVRAEDIVAALDRAISEQTPIATVQQWAAKAEKETAK